MAIDCSDEAQDKRKLLLLSLMEKRYSGVQSVSDRTRSVTYHDPNDLNKLISSLSNEIALCDGSLSRRTVPRRIFQPPYVKWF